MKAFEKFKTSMRRVFGLEAKPVKIVGGVDRVIIPHAVRCMHSHRGDLFLALEDGRLIQSTWSDEFADFQFREISLPPSGLGR